MRVYFTNKLTEKYLLDEVGIEINDSLYYWLFDSKESFHCQIINNGVSDFYVFFDNRLPNIYLPSEFCEVDL